MSRKALRAAVIATLSLLAALLAFAPAGAQDDDSPERVKDPNDPATRVSGDLLELDVQAATNRSAQPGNELLPIVDDTVVVDITAGGDPAEVLSRLEDLGFENGSVAGGLVSGQLPISEIGNVGRVDGVLSVLPAYASTNVGNVTAQSDQSMRADEARSAFGIDGSGVTIGTLSDSFNCLGQQAADVASNDLPAGINVLDDSQCPGSDEGRAMMQIIHDSVPGADQQFHTAFGGQADFANGILELAAAGSDVIVDDVFYFAEPFFQDGQIAQAANQVSANGVPYFTSAGNSARDSYESGFRDSGINGPSNFGSPAHDFDPGPGVDITQRVRVPLGATVSLSFQWDDPFQSVSGGSGADSDLDIFLLNSAGTIVDSAAFNNIGGDAVEVIVFTNNTGSQNLDIVIEHFSGPEPGVIKYVGFRNLDIIEHDTNSGTAVGHSNADGALSTGAAWYVNTPEFGQSPPLVEPFSSAGGVRVLFDTNGNPIDENRRKPDFVAPDGVDTTFFGSDADGNGFPNFFGTSAAAPAAAAGAALILDEIPGASVADIKTALQSTAIDMSNPGFDFNTGEGLIQIDLAIDALSGPICDGQIVTVNIGQGDVPTTGDDVIFGTPGADVINASAGDDIICGLGGNDTINGGTGNDTIFGGSGNDTIRGQGGNDELRGQSGLDQINGGVGNDTIFGGTEADDLRGQGGNDTLMGDDGVDQFFGGSGQDTIVTGNGGNTGTVRVVRGQSGADIITGSPQNDTLDGGPGQDEIFGGNGNDILNGGPSGDFLRGQGGNDILNGGPDRDDLGGGGGTDTCDGGGASNDTADATCETVIAVP